MKTINIIQNEHRALAVVLQALRFVVGEIGEGRQAPDFRLLAAMVDYITHVPEEVHHPREENALFPRLRSRSPKAKALIETLEAQHADGPMMTIALLQALVHYQSVGERGFARFNAVVQHYLDFSWEHLNQEEDELLPLAREVLNEDDWQALDAAFASNFDPYSGVDGEFAELFSLIEKITPAPQGLGSTE